MTRIDAHHHVWRPVASPLAAAGWSPRVHDWPDAPAMAPVRRDLTLHDLAPEAAAAGIDRTVPVQVPPDTEETAEASSYRDVVLTAEELTIALNVDERAEVFGGTAARAYRLSPDRLLKEAL